MQRHSPAARQSKTANAHEPGGSSGKEIAAAGRRRGGRGRPQFPSRGHRNSSHIHAARAADPLAPHFPGVYLYDDWSAEPRMWKIDPTSSTQTKTGGIFGYALTGGIASASVKAVIPGEEARFVSPKSNPVFYVYPRSCSISNSGRSNV